MGTAWTEAIGTLLAVWANARSGVSQKKACVWMPSSPRPLRKEGRSCCTFREGTPRWRKRPLRSAFGSRTTTARFLWTGCRGQCCGLDARQHPAALGWQFASFTMEGQQ
ncbi:trans-sialidase [Trypanosoma cruzi]|nr:trans-sialidase [Trypanosoma cruzi]